MLNKTIEGVDKLRLAVFDSDGVLVPRGTQIAQSFPDNTTVALDLRTKLVTPELADKLNRLKQHMHVALASGRALLYLKEAYAPVFDSNLHIIAENGNVLFTEGTVRQKAYPAAYFEALNNIRQDIIAAGDTAVRGLEPKVSILTVHCSQKTTAVTDIVQRHNPGYLTWVWGGEAYDIMHKDVNKAVTVGELAEQLGVQREEIIAIGDRDNDREMVERAGVGVSAAPDHLEADYWTEDDGSGALPGEQLADYLLKHM